ncbi:MAG: ABC transporter ATP-binding protein [candidate division WOR-3 bacterium]
MTSLFIALLGLPGPFLTRFAIDKVFPNRNIHLLTLVAIGLLFLSVTTALSSYISSLLMFIFRSKVTVHIQQRLFEHIEHLNMIFHDRTKTGESVSILTGDVSNLQGLMADILVAFSRNLVTFIIGVITLCSLNWRLALLALGIMPLFIYSTYVFSGQIRKKSGAVQKNFACLLSFLFGWLSAISLIKTSWLEKEIAIRLRNRLEESFAINLSFTKTFLLSGSIAMFIGSLGAILILWYGGQEIMKGRLTLGSFVAFNAILNYLYTPIQVFMGLNSSIQKAFASLERVFTIYNIPAENGDANMPVPADKRMDISFDNVVFGFLGKKPVLHNMSFEIKYGEKVAIVGRSGSGKTTLVKLLLKFYTPEKGRIGIAGIDIRSIRTSDLRKKIGVVHQNEYVLPGTMRDNVRIGKPDASDDELFQALRHTNLYDFIVGLPAGLDTEIGERGVGLSDGEVQRLAISRVILRDPDILIFDEAFSEIDPQSESLIREAIFQLFRDRTVIFITHRLSDVAWAERVIFIDAGRFIGTAPHNELLATLPDYREFWEANNAG